ncbi:MAG: M67 family metallopeptidase [Nitrososphaerota archaeon]|nr:M67 family metallopeptidase [Nitrososphaerota archaeon]
MKVRLSRILSDMLLEEARRSYPIEACGVLFGSIHGDEMRIEAVVPLRNILESEYTFEIDPEEFLKVLVEYEGRGLRHIGFFHSHPGCVKPSTIDLRYMKLWPETIWMIVSYRESRIRAYRIIDESLDEATVIIE